MFFVASKIFWLVAQPLSLVFLLMVGGLVLLALRRRRSAIVTLAAAILLHGTVSFTNLGYILIQPLEDRFTAPVPPPEEVDTIIMLGGATLTRPSTVRQIAELNEAGDRLTTTLWLARAYPGARIVVSGGSSSMLEEAEVEARTAERFFLAHGIPQDRLVLEEGSRNTDENVANTVGMLGEAGSTVLVTSAFHMPRSIGMFEKAGFDLVPWPTDYRSPGPMSFGFDLANPTQNMAVSTIAIREWIGLLVYHWTGRTAQLLPGP